jgi:predicted O-methyltransferase YrrM
MKERVALFEQARRTRGFMPEEEGVALYEAANEAARRARLNKRRALIVEIGSWCGKSTLYLAAAAIEEDGIVFAVDHHRGSEEQQVGWEHHDPELVNQRTGRIDTLGAFRQTIEDAQVEDRVIALVGDSPTIGTFVQMTIDFLFIDGGHGSEPAHLDLTTWSPRVVSGGLFAIHDVFVDPKDGGRPPYEIWQAALSSGRFREYSHTGSLRVVEAL